MFVVTGVAGFIGSNIVRELNLLGEAEILVVDSLKSSPNPAHPKFLNLTSARFADFMDKREFRAALAAGRFERQRFRAIFHNGACSHTLEDDGQYTMCNNFTYSKELIHFAIEGQIPLIYASSAAVYVLSFAFAEVETASERSLRDAVLDSVYHHLLADVPVGRLNDFGALLHEAWMNKKKMATQISDSHIDELYEATRKHGALGGKISGAGGGGYMFLYCNSNKRHFLAEQMERMGGQVVDFSFDFRGLQTWHAK
jgi:hypothetical protein